MKMKLRITPSPHQFLLEKKTASYHSQVQGEMILDLQTKKKTHRLITILVTPNQFLYRYLTILTLHLDD